MPRHRAPQRRFDGTQVRAARKARDWTNEDLAHEVGCTLRSVQRWQTGYGPSGFQLLQLCRVLDLDPDALYVEDDAVA